MDRIAQSPLTVKLESGKILDVPEGAEPGAFRRHQQAMEDRANTPPKKKPHRTRTRRARKTFRASQVLTGTLSQRDSRISATADLVKRNKTEPESDAILVSCGKKFEVLV